MLNMSLMVLSGSSKYLCWSYSTFHCDFRSMARAMALLTARVSWTFSIRAFCCASIYLFSMSVKENPRVSLGPASLEIYLVKSGSEGW